MSHLDKIRQHRTRFADQGVTIMFNTSHHSRPTKLREPSPEAIALWKAACELEDAGPRGLDIGLLLAVRDKINVLLGDTK
jgi:hypothetical protein